MYLSSIYLASKPLYQKNPNLSSKPISPTSSACNVSQKTEQFAFDVFVEFVTRYGCLRDFLQTLKEVTYFDAPASLNAQFVHWFSPCCDVNSRVLNACDWLLIPAVITNALSLYHKNEKSVVYLHIRHDLVAVDQSKRYSAKFRDGTKYA